MENRKKKISTIMKMDSPREIADNLPKGVVSFLLATPAMLFIIAMAAVLFSCLISQKNIYSSVIHWVNCDGAILGLFGIAAYLLKLHYSNKNGASVFKNPTVICFGVMIVFMLLSALRNGISADALIGDSYRKESLFCFIIYPAIYYFVSSLIDSETVKRRLINGFLAVSFLLAAFSFLHVVASAHGFSRLAAFTAPLCIRGVIGIYHQINHYGYSLVLAITLSGAMFVAASGKLSLRLFYLATFALCNAVLVLNDSFGSYLAVFITLFFLGALFLIRDKKLNPYIFILFAVFIAVSFTVNPGAVRTNITTFLADISRVFGNMQGSVSSPEANRAGTTRWGLWKSTLKMIFERPVFGFGVEGICDRLTAEAGSNRPHCELLQYAAFFGIPALLCYVSGVVSVFVSFLRCRMEASPCTVAALTAAFGYFVSSCFGNTMYYTTPLFFIVLGLADMRPQI